MNEKLKSLEKKIEELEDREFELEEDLDDVRLNLEEARKEYKTAEMSLVNLSDRVTVQFTNSSKLPTSSQEYPAKIVGDLAIIRMHNNWQICSVFKGQKICDCPSLEVALELIEVLQQFDWSFAVTGESAPKNIGGFIRQWLDDREANA
jgi:hypothetical protein